VNNFSASDCLSGLVLSLAVFVAPLPARAQDQRSTLVQADRAAAQLCRDSGMAATLRRHLHPTGVLLWPGAPLLVGAKKVLQFTRARELAARQRLTWQSVRLELSRDSALAALWGVALASGSRDSFPPRLGRVLSVWRRDAERWSLAALLLVGPAAVEDSSPNTEPPPQPSPLSRTRETSRFVDADIAFAELAKDSGAAVAFRTWAADDAVTFGGAGLLIRGKEEISRAVAGSEHWEWHPVVAGSSGPGGDLGWTAGEAVIGGRNGVRYSKYLTVWRSAGGQPVRYILDAGNSRPNGPP
jgi:ketosteroid isomerase-like protein